ncbi:MAG: geranylgeranylglycerol-phosphate geranylgeranyltransferase [Candidatus Hodarchaeales archaeon]
MPDISLSRKLRAYFFLIRPLNTVMAGFGIFVGAYSCIGTLENTEYLFYTNLIPILIAGVACSLITAGGYVINDYYDYEIDLINMPHRSLPSGAISLKEAKYLAFILFITGFLTSFFIRQVEPFPFDPLAVFFAFIGVICVYAYSSDLKRMGIVGNITVSSMTAIPFLYGGAVVQNYGMMWVPFIFAFSISMGREIIKDIEDVEGDEVGGMKSLPMRIGLKKAALISHLWLVLLIILIPSVFLLKLYYSWGFLLFGTIITVIFLYIIFHTNPFAYKDEEIVEHCTLAKRLLKSCMFLGIIAFVLAPITPV